MRYTGFIPILILLLAAALPSQAAPWEFQQRLYDVDTTYANWQNYLNAVPVGLAFTHSGRGYLATLHTVFQTTDGGRTWQNLDRFPPPQPHASGFAVVRSPSYISDLAAWPTPRDSLRNDSLYISAFNAEHDTGAVWLIQYSGAYHWLYPQQQLGASSWLTSLVIPDSSMAVAISGLDGELYRNDSLNQGMYWQELSPVKAFPHSGRVDSITPGETWVKGVTSAGPFIIAVGLHHWISRDRGRLWHITPAADAQSNEAVSFCDSTHGMVGGGVTTPARRGWVHFTNNGGRGWSGRSLESDLPVRAVLRLSPALAFAAGGLRALSQGRIWATTDGGASWSVESEATAEMMKLAATRVNNAYVDVIAAGVFEDYRGGVWRARVFLPGTAAGAVIFGDPDTLDFGVVAPGALDTQTVFVRNTGSVADSVLAISGAAPFMPLETDALALEPGQSVPLHILLSAGGDGIAAGTVQLVTRHSGTMEIFCRADVDAAAEPGRALLPQAQALEVWPNPANAIFAIRYDLARAGNVRLRVYDLTGRLTAELVNAHAEAGTHTLSWNAANYASGLYFLRLDAAEGALTRKLLLLK